MSTPTEVALQQHHQRELQPITPVELRRLLMSKGKDIDVPLMDKLFVLLRELKEPLLDTGISDIVDSIKSSRHNNLNELFESLYAALERHNPSELTTEASAINIYGEIFARIKELKMAEDMYVEEEELLNASQRKYLEELTAKATLDIMTGLNKGLLKYRQFVTTRKRSPEEDEAEELGIPLSLEKDDLIEYAISRYQLRENDTDL